MPKRTDLKKVLMIGSGPVIIGQACDEPLIGGHQVLTVGDVGNIAEVELNGNRVGVCWIRRQSLDITDAVKAGTNSLVIRVTNTLINRVAGLKELPPVPDHLQPRFGVGPHDKTSPARRLMGFEPLPRSGLMGPVRINAFKRVRVPFS